MAGPLLRSLWSSTGKSISSSSSCSTQSTVLKPYIYARGLTRPFSRGLVGYRSVFSSDTRGIGFMQHAFRTYAKHRGPLGNVRKGVLAYDGMIVGEHSRDTNLDVNPVRAKELTNVCAAGKDENVKLSPPCLMTLEEEAIGYVASDELIEKPPKNDSDPMIKRFEEWMKRHNRQYRNEDEWKYRFEIYRKNVQHIDHVNSQNLSFKLGDNKFADMGSKEFKSKCTGYKPLTSEERKSMCNGYKPWRQRIV